MSTYFVYILSNKSNSVIYIGVTNNLERRCFEHRNKTHPGFTAKYNVYKLIYFEEYADILLAINREKEVKKWSRNAKNKLIEKINPSWIDLYSKNIEIT